MRRSQNRYSGYRGRRTANDLLKRIALVLAVLVLCGGASGALLHDLIAALV